MNIKDMIKKYDPQNQFDVLINSYKQIDYTLKNKYNIDSVDTTKIKNIVLTGLGGSAISGDVFMNYAREELSIPFNVNRNYNLPNYVDENTLIIASSYSGNTEETLSAAKEAVDRECQIICITTGGKLLELAAEYNLPVALLEKGYQPRYAFWINIFTLINVMQKLNFISEQSGYIQNVMSLIKHKGQVYSMENNPALSFAEKLIGFIPVIYSADSYTSGLGNRFKEQINENSKLHAFHNVFPEMNHNEIIGWETFNESQFNAKVIMLNDKEYHSRIQRRFEIVKKILNGSGVEILKVQSSGNHFKVRLFDMIYFTDWISYYLAIIRGKDPSSIKNINYLKEELAKSNT